MALPDTLARPAAISVAAGVGMTPALIAATGVHKRFPGGIHALDDVTLDIRAGEFVALLGPSGCGKSTFLRCLAGLDGPTAGRLTLAGQPITEPPRSLGIALQRDALLDWRDVLDNVLLPADFGGLSRRALEPKARALLDMVGLTDFAHAYPAALSGGMRQRVAICRALLLDPPLLLMDEPFGALDALTRDQLNVDLHRLWAARRMTVVFVTHSIVEALFLSTRVVVFGPRPGRPVEDVTVDLPGDPHADGDWDAAGAHRRLAVRETPEFGALSRRLRARFEAMGLLRE